MGILNQRLFERDMDFFVSLYERKVTKKPKFPRCVLPPNKVKPSKKIYDRNKLRKEKKHVQNLYT
jgi:hypothetical protein